MLVSHFGFFSCFHLRFWYQYWYQNNILKIQEKILKRENEIKNVYKAFRLLEIVKEMLWPFRVNYKTH